MMLKIVEYYKSLSFEKKTIFTVRFSILFNLLLAISKILLSFNFGIFFLVAGIVNVFIMLAKLECYLGEKKYKNKTFQYRNKRIGIFLIIAGLEYAIYMCRMVLTDIDIMRYDIILGICVACVSFIELAIAIKGCFDVYGKGHYYRNIKLISLCSALTSIVLTQVAITSFAARTNTRLLNGLFGMGVGIIIILISCYIFIAPKISIIDREHNIYISNGVNEVSRIEIKLTQSMLYGNYVYIGTRIGNKIEGNIIKMKSPLFSWKIHVNILVILLSEILIFPYAIGALIFHFKSIKIIDKLDLEMEKLGFKKKI